MHKTYATLITLCNLNWLIGSTEQQASLSLSSSFSLLDHGETDVKICLLTLFCPWCKERQIRFQQQLTYLVFVHVSDALLL